ncbi:aldo/keto reductase [Paenibacillus glycanilyticus]|uniref:Aldo/keto reductase n=1 Tax=Paenibacillus glycanilyticus TaxID=126569 RepID=A0ABQ6GJD4_9BACL|nr:aldo/keto reductase [Paenibacillus glycanilyticus]GLX70812.1 aldo/keto reductase [Paenibacillus glycanilyticus]
MLYKNNDVQLHKLGLGCGGRMSNDHNKEEKIATIHEALEYGINHLNTADFYGSGKSELIIGEALKGQKREQAYVSVKFGMLTAPNGGMYGLDVRPLAIKNYLTYTLKRLNLDYIDLYQPARIDLGIPVEETIGAVADLVKAGYVRQIGVSQVDADTLRKANSVHPISFVEMEYSLFNRSIEHDIMPTARELGIGVVAFGALAHGLLSGTCSKDSETHSPWVPLFFEQNIDRNLELVEQLRTIADEKHVTVPQLALAWMLTKGEDLITIIGASRRTTLQDSLKAVNVKLSADDIQKIETAVSPEKIAGNSFPNMKFRNGVAAV